MQDGRERGPEDVLAGVAAGVVVSLVMAVGRRSGVLHKTLAEEAEDWLDRVAASRRLVGRGGTTALEQANHIVASGIFGVGYGVLRAWVPRVPAVVLGSLYGAGLYAVNIAGIAPLIGLTEGERNVPMPVRAERLGVHVLYGAVTAVVREWLDGSR